MKDVVPFNNGLTSMIIININKDLLPYGVGPFLYKYLIIL